MHCIYKLSFCLQCFGRSLTSLIAGFSLRHLATQRAEQRLLRSHKPPNELMIDTDSSKPIQDIFTSLHKVRHEAETFSLPCPAKEKRV